MTNEVMNHLTWLVNRVCEKPVWGRAVEQTEPFKTFYKSLKKNLDITKLTLEEARELRFLRWDEHGKLYLFPLWVVPLIPEGLMVTSIGGETFPFDDRADLDARFGCVAFGLNFSDQGPEIAYCGKGEADGKTD